jgi:hypothetical protein
MSSKHQPDADFGNSLASNLLLEARSRRREAFKGGFLI